MTRRKSRPTWVYLIHFESPIGNPDSPHGTAQHYLGTTSDLARRLGEHSRGESTHCTRIMAAVHAAGVGWALARTWERPDGDGYELERKLKNWKNHRKLCPICQGKKEETCP